jgi:GNAT superfamily N-acetyltransferase
MKDLLRRLLPQSDEHLLMGRAGAAPAPELGTAGVDMRSIRSVSDPNAGMLEAFASAHGFPEGWTREMIGEGASAVIALDEANTMLAMGWITGRPFYVDEIRATIDPGAGFYLFGDFVEPAHRGRKLQRRLVGERLRLTETSAFACTLVHPSNLASVRSYSTEGFAVGGQFVRYRWRGRTWARCRAVGRAAVTFALSGTDRILVARL